jgi:hypothetical protein
MKGRCVDVPRRNSNVIEKKRAFHGATQYHTGYREGCSGCPFVGFNFSCNTSDGKCLKSPAYKKGNGKKRGKNKWKEIM